MQEIFNLVKDEYSVIDRYQTAIKKIRFKHNIKECEYIWKTTPNNFLRGTKCPKCSGRLTHKDFVELVSKITKGEFEILGRYESKKAIVKMRHNNKGCNNYEWDYYPRNATKTKEIRCPKCINIKLKEKFKKSVEVYKNEVDLLVGKEYSVLGEYVNSNTAILMKHNYCIDGGTHEWKVTPGHFLKGTRCSKCFGTRVKTTEEYKKEVELLTQNEYTVVSEYINAKTKIKIKHNIVSCGHVWEVIPRKILNGRGCPKCKESKGERKIRIFLEKNNIKFKPQFRIEKCKNKRPLPFDFAIFDENNKLILLIEYQGIQHYTASKLFGGIDEFEKRKVNDQIKLNYCNENKIKLLRIKYTEFNNIEKIICENLKNSI